MCRFFALPSRVIALVFTLVLTSPIYAQDAATLDQIAQLGGSVADAALDHGLAYVGHEVTLRVVDLNTLDEVAHVLLDEGLHSVTLDGDHVYLGLSQSLAIYDRSDPANLSRLGILPLSDDDGTFTKTVRKGDVLFLAHRVFGDGTDHLYVIDVSDPSTPTLLDEIEIASPAGLVLGGDHLYLLTQAPNEVVVFDVSDPANPIEGATLDVEISLALAHNGAHLFLALTGGRMRVLDMSDPAVPAAVTSVEIGNAQDAVTAIAVDSGRAYLSQNEDLFVVDVTDPANPTVLGQGSTADAGRIISTLLPFDLAGKRQTSGVAVAGGTFRLMDVTDEANPTLDRRLEMPASANLTAFVGEKMYVADDRTYVFDVSSGAPVPEGSFDGTGPGTDRALAIEGETLYRIGSLGDVEVLDLAGDDPPPVVGTLATGLTGVNAMTVRGNLAFLASFQTLTILDVSTAAAPAERASLQLGDDAVVDVLAPAGSDLVYAASCFCDLGAPATGQLYAVDVSDPANPQVLQTEDLAGDARALALDGNTLFAASVTKGSTGFSDGSAVEVFEVGGDGLLTGPTDTFPSDDVLADLSLVDGFVAITFPGPGAVRVFEVAGGTGKQQDIDLVQVAEAPVKAAGEITVGQNGSGNSFTVAAGALQAIHRSLFKGLSKGFWTFQLQEGDDGPTVTLAMDLQPPAAQADGCTTDPAPGSETEHSLNATATVHAITTQTCADEGWNFHKWTGSIDRTSATTQILMDEDKEAIANFARGTLSLNVTGPDILRCPDAADRILIGEIALTANTLPDPLPDGHWRLDGLTIHPLGQFGTVPTTDTSFVQSNFLESVILTYGPVTQSSDRVQAHPDGTLPPVSFSGMDLDVDAGETKTVKVFYQPSEDVGCPLDIGIQKNSLAWSFEVRIAEVQAEPHQNFNGTLLPEGGTLSSPETALACVHNITSGTNFNGIQVAIDDAGTQAGQTVEVCPGTYFENVTLSKGIVLRSREGAEGTTIKALFDEQPAIVMNAPERATLQGFFITNGLSGIDVETDGHAIGVAGGAAPTKAHHERARNVIAGNDGSGISVRGDSTTIGRNFIGVAADGQTRAANGGHGVLIQGASENHIDFNTISGNRSNGVVIEAGSGKAEENEILGNTIGLAQDGQTPVGNANDGIRIQNASNNVIEGNTISSNGEHGVTITISSVDEKADNNHIVSNIIGLDAGGTEKRGNGGNGILAGGTGTIIGGENSLYRNVISGNTTNGVSIQADTVNVSNNFIGLATNGKTLVGNGEEGVQITSAAQVSIYKNEIFGQERRGIFATDTDALGLVFNAIWKNNVGIELRRSTDVYIGSNELVDNGTCGVLSESSGGRIVGNNVEDCFEDNTGFHLTDAAFEIASNYFANNAGAGVFLEGTATATIAGNNFSGHPDVAVRNDTGMPIDAQGNFWGAADGPSGAGPGSGDAVSGDVDISGFLTEPVAVVLSAAEDTVRVDAGAADSISFFIRNFVTPVGSTVNLTLTDELDWLTGETSVSVTLDDSLGTEVVAHMAPPAGLPDGTENVVEVTATADEGTASASVMLVTGDVTSVGIENENDPGMPGRFALHGNYPNPFNPTTTLVFDVPEAARVRVAIVDLLGRVVLTLPPKPVDAGAGRTLAVDASSLASGLYLYRVIAETPTRTMTATGRMVMVK